MIPLIALGGVITVGLFVVAARASRLGALIVLLGLGALMVLWVIKVVLLLGLGHG